MQQLGEAAANLTPEMLEGALNLQMVENICLLPNSSDTAYVGVNMYCDDQAQLKELAPNPRASQIASCCGRPLEVRGDAFLARIFDDENNFKRLDLPLSEVSSSADWVKQAAALVRRKAASSASNKDFLDRVNQRNLAQQQAPAAAPSAQVRELSAADVEKEAGNAAFKKGLWQDAIERYSAALQLDSALLPALNNRAMAHLKMGQHQAAEEDCSKVLQQEPGNVKALLRRATAREALGRPFEAQHDLQAVLALEPGNKEAVAGGSRLAAAIAQLPLPPPPPLPSQATEEEQQ